MKHLLGGVAVAAALAILAPAWAQPANPSGGNAMGMPGPNPGGPGLTPYSSGSRPMAPAAMAPSAGAPPTAESTSVVPPSHRHARHAAHGKMAAHHRGKGPQLTGSNADQLNQEEVARLQAGNMPMPPAPGMAPEPAGPTPTPPRRPPIGSGPGANLPGPKQSGGY